MDAEAATHDQSTGAMPPDGNAALPRPCPLPQPSDASTRVSTSRSPPAIRAAHSSVSQLPDEDPIERGED
jgi:hypothetical protein